MDEHKHNSKINTFIIHKTCYLHLQQMTRIYMSGFIFATEYIFVEAQGDY
jgi:hypothetical protein